MPDSIRATLTRQASFSYVRKFGAPAAFMILKRVPKILIFRAC